jgi:hypothetical protein
MRSVNVSGFDIPFGRPGPRLRGAMTCTLAEIVVNTNIAGPLLPIQDLPPLGFASQAVELIAEDGVE